MDESLKMHPYLIEIHEKIYSQAGLSIEGFEKESESQDYVACRFRLNNRRIIFRVAKITPKKVGQFVSIWKRVDSDCIRPFDMADPFDLIVVTVRSSAHLGQFVFPKSVLYEKGIVSQDGVGGKLGIRVYPPWDQAKSKQAIKTQKWQLLYFFEISEGSSLSSVKKLFSS